jgi:uncharacterized protein YbaR (Trm112 family)
MRIRLCPRCKGFLKRLYEHNGTGAFVCQMCGMMVQSVENMELRDED